MLGSTALLPQVTNLVRQGAQTAEKAFFEEQKEPKEQGAPVCKLPLVPAIATGQFWYSKTAKATVGWHWL